MNPARQLMSPFAKPASLTLLATSMTCRLGNGLRWRLEHYYIAWMHHYVKLNPLTDLGCAQVHRFQRQAAGYRRKLVSAPNSLFSKSRFEDFPDGWNK